MRRVILAVVCITLVSAFLGPVPVATAAPAPTAPTAPADPQAGLGPDDPGTDQMIVRLTGHRLPTSSLLPVVGGQPVTSVREMTDGAWVVRLPEVYSNAAADQLARSWTARAGVQSAEPDLRMFPTATPNDSKYPSQWDLGVPGTSFGANLPGAWDMTTGSSDVVTAVLDTGYTDHEDLTGRFLPGYDFVDNELVANDGDGRDSNAHDPGDWVTTAEPADSSLPFFGCTVRNSEWHGTHVAGTVGATSNNSLGVAGINWVSKILPVRVLGKCGGYTSDIVDAIRWAAGLTVSGVPANPTPADVINLSLGAKAGCGSTYQVAIDAAVAAGTLVVAAAGNDNEDAALHAPASCNDVISVAATARNGNRASYSNYGTSVDIAAPGGDQSVDTKIWSTVTSGGTGPGPSAYAAYQGTSMAAPHVSGVASLIKSVYPQATPAQLTSFLTTNVTAFPLGSTCTTVTCGTGIVNAAAAVGAAYAYGPPGYLRVVTSPPVPSMITTDFVPRDEFGLSWLNATPAYHDVCFGPVPGYLTPPCQHVFVRSGQTTTVTGTFTQQGYLAVVTDPPVPSTVSIDGTAVNEWGAWIPTTAGSHTVCFGAVAGFDVPACRSVVVTAGATATTTGTFAANPSAPGPTPGYGYLRVTTNPPVAATVQVDGVARDNWGLNWLKIAPGSHTVCFAALASASGPPCQTVTVTAGTTTSVEGAFALKGSLRAITEPSLNASISVDGPVADNYGVWRTASVGPHTICWGQVPGYVTPTSCQTVTVVAGATSTATYTYVPT